MLRAPRMPNVGPFRPEMWRSPLRGPWLASLLSSALLPLVLVCAITGFLSHAAYQTHLGHNAVFGGPRPGNGFDIYGWSWPTSPAWLYAATQGAHMIAGLAAIPLLLAKLWAVIPKLWENPPFHSFSQAVERLSLGLLVGSSLFVIGTGALNIQIWYPFRFSFVPAHYYAAIVFVAALALHLAVKLPVVWRAFRRIALLAPRGRGDFPVNKTFAAVGIDRSRVGPRWRLTLSVDGEGRARLTRERLLAMEQVSARLPIACVEGWSTTQHWTGVRLSDLPRLAGAPDAEQVEVRSLKPRGPFRRATLNRDQLHAPGPLLAL